MYPWAVCRGREKELFRAAPVAQMEDKLVLRWLMHLLYAAADYISFKLLRKKM